jgi:hypothetical protein
MPELAIRSELHRRGLRVRVNSINSYPIDGFEPAIFSAMVTSTPDRADRPTRLPVIGR